MEMKKKWEEYTDDEKTSLLNHWFFYYGGMLMTLKDLTDFRALAATKQDDIFNHIVTSYCFTSSIQSNILIMFMRENKAEELFTHSIAIEKLSPENQEAYLNIRNLISTELITTFVSPEKSVPMDITTIIVDEGPRHGK